MAENGGNGGKKKPRFLDITLSENEMREWQKKQEELDLEGEHGAREAQILYGQRDDYRNVAEKVLEANQLRKVKKEIKRTVKKTLKRPYLKNGIIQRKAENEEKDSTHQTLRHNMDKYRKNLTRIQNLGSAKVYSLSAAERLQRRIEEEDDKLTQNSKPIKFQLMLIDLKRAFSGPVGWALSCKNCFSKFCIMVCFVGSSVALTLLSATGVL